MNEFQLKSLKNIAEEFHLKKLVLFGSFLNDPENAVDIDFACEGATGKDFLKLGVRLEDIFNKEIDLVMLENDEAFSKIILNRGKLIYESINRRD